MGNVLAFASFAEAIALDGLGQNDRRLAFGLHGSVERGIDLDGIMAAKPQLLQLLIRHVADDLEQSRVSAKEVLANIRARFDGKLLPLAIDDFGHAASKNALTVGGE